MPSSRIPASTSVRGRAGSTRDYRPRLSLPDFDAKLLKPQNVVEMLHIGSRDIGFAGRDWVREKNAELVELIDTGLDPVELVAAVPVKLLVDGRLPDHHLVVASEYERLARFMDRRSGTGCHLHTLLRRNGGVSP